MTDLTTDLATAARPARSIAPRRGRRLLARAGVLVVVGGLAFGTTACSTNDIVKGAIESASGGKVSIDADGGKIAVKGDKGESFQLNMDGKLPADFPSDIPLPQGAKALGGANITDPTSRGGTGGGVSLTTNQDAAAVAGFFKSRLPGAGWNVKDGFSMSGSSAGRSGTFEMIVASKGDRQISVTVSPTDERGASELGKTMILVSYAKDVSSSSPSMES